MRRARTFSTAAFRSSLVSPNISFAEALSAQGEVCQGGLAAFKSEGSEYQACNLLDSQAQSAAGALNRPRLRG